MERSYKIRWRWLMWQNLYLSFLLLEIAYLYIFSPSSRSRKLSGMKVVKSFAIILLVCISTVGIAQDVHFSQYYASPLNLNPAFTGGFNGMFRAVVNYRNQWFSALGSSSYVTYSGSFDAPILRKKLNYDQLGVGGVIYNDRSGDGGLTNLTVMVGLAYHKSLDQFNRFSLALGAHAGITQKRVDFSSLLFENDIVGGPAENVSQSSFIYPDFSIGLLFRGSFTDRITAYVGGSAVHLHRPEETFLTTTGEGNRIEPRFNVHGGIDFGIGENVTLTPGFLYKLQNNAQEITPGVAFGYRLTDISALYLGAWFRALDTDALIAMAAFEVSGFRVGLSYDVNLSDYKPASNGQGGLEVSLIYIHKQEATQQISPVKFCPRF